MIRFQIIKVVVRYKAARKVGKNRLLAELVVAQNTNVVVAW